MSFANQNSLPFTERGIAQYSPTRSGVYGIYNNRTWIYVGEAGDIQARLLEHVRGQSTESGCILQNNPTSFTYELVEANQRMAREAQLRSELRSVCNQQ
jgi:excinuclease UvrABC nuclease subunit